MKLNKDQLKSVSQIFLNSGHVFLASMVVPIFVDIDKVNPAVVTFGLILTISCWIISVIILKGRGKQK